MDITNFENTFANYSIDMYNRNAYQAAQDFSDKKMKKGTVLAIFGLPGTGKTTLLKAVANHYEKQDASTIRYLTEAELKEELKLAKSRKDIFMLTPKRKLWGIETVCLDEVDKLISDDEIQSGFIRWLNYCKRHSKRIIYTYDCDEKMYCAFQELSKLDPKTIAVGIPKPGQNRNMEVIKFIE